MAATVLEALNQGLLQAMEADERVFLLGEDILDPYGGAFKVTRGLSSRYPSRVMTTPISEAGIVGIAGGMALRGLLPVVEIMFGDFSTLITDALVNSITKFQWMYNGQANVPVVIRTPMGGRRGYGPTHSQSLEKLFLGVPGLKVLAPSSWGEPGALLRSAILEETSPIFFVENKLQYLEKLKKAETSPEFEVISHLPEGQYAPLYQIRLKQAPAPQVTILAYGYMASLAEQAMLQLAYEYEIFCDLLIPTRLSPFGEANALPAPVMASIQKTGNLLTVEESTLTLGWGAEILARAVEQNPTGLKNAGRIAAADTPIPASMKQEENMLPQINDIVHAVLRMVKS